MALKAPIVIAHRGASGYLPEHTLEAKSLAHAMGADFIEQDVVLSSDGVPVVLHDIFLDSTTDVARRFADRARPDGRYYAIDFSLIEIKQLQAHERSERDEQGLERAVYPQRFPLGSGNFRVPTLAEEIDLIAGLDQSRGRTTGLYIELKAPRWHLDQGYDSAQAILAILKQKGYDQRADQVYLQCFDDITLKRLHSEFNTLLPLIQLIGENNWGEDTQADFEHMRSSTGLAEVAGYAQGIGPWIPHIVQPADTGGMATLTPLVEQAHEAGLLVHPYTLRQDELACGITDSETLLKLLFDQAGVDGLFTDFPDLVVDFLQQSGRLK